MRHLIALISLCAAPAMAQELNFDMWQTDQCLQTGDSYVACAGTSAEACMSNTPGGFSTYAMGGCLDAELTVWDARLNAAYKDLMAQAKSFDSDNAGFGPSQAEALREMQRKWIPFRDAKCDFARSQWGGGTGGGPAALSCLLSETANQTQYLVDSRIGG